MRTKGRELCGDGTMHNDGAVNPATPTWLELERICLLPEVVRVTSLSGHTVKRRYRPYLVNLSQRRIGMKLRHVLAITTGTLPSDSTVAPRRQRKADAASTGTTL
jgi:hypothetical protein